MKNVRTVLKNILNIVFISLVVFSFPVKAEAEDTKENIIEQLSFDCFLERHGIKPVDNSEKESYEEVKSYPDYNGEMDISEYEEYIENVSVEYEIDPNIVRAVIYNESRGVADAYNGIAYGLMQINLQYENAFIKGAGVSDVKDPYNNIKAGCWYISELYKKGGSYEYALTAYGLGESEAKERINSGDIPEYVKRELKMASELEA